jgi:LmbE family N-acetylglucosaminyl deacetylase
MQRALVDSVRWGATPSASRFGTRFFPFARSLFARAPWRPALGLRALLAFAGLCAVGAPAAAQLEPIPEDTGSVGLALKLRKLASGTSLLHTAAHPDDEDNGFLVLMSRGRGHRVELLTATRGDGGQNEIGPELFEAIGILRTEELMAAHRIDGVEQYFTRAYEFGYSFSVEETLQKWGREEILGDFVRILRKLRPDVVVSLPLEGEGGGQHHQASAILTREAFRAAADPARFPEQIAEGLRPWQALKLYSRRSVGTGAGRREKEDQPASLVRIDTGIYDPLLGRTYHQLGSEARSNHKCQGMGQLEADPGPRESVFHLEDSVLAPRENEGDLFDGIEVGLGRWKDFSDEPFVSLGIDEIQVEIDAASAAFDARAPWKTLPSLRRGLIRLRGLRADVAGSGLPPNEKLELEHRLAPREREFEEAIALAHGIDFLPTSSRGEVTRGSRFRIEVQVTNGSPEPVEVRAIRVLTGPGSLVQEFEDDETRFPDLPERLSGTRKLEARFDVTMGPAAPYDRPYWVRTDPSIDRFTLLEPELFGRPSRPPGLVSALSLQSGEVEITLAKPVQYRYPGRWVGGEKQKRVSVLPRVSVEISPDVVVFPVGSDDRTRPLSVTARYEGTEPALGSLRLEAPAGFVVEPQSVPLTFSRENEASTVRFQLTPGAAVERGSYLVHAVAEIGGEEFRESVDSIEYHHIETRYLFEPAQAKVEALDLQMAPVRVGYIEGVGDDVPMAIRQLGAELSFLGEADLAEGDLSKYDVIVTGVRAYLNRQDLRAYNRRLLDYVSEGGTLLVQYNKMEFNEAPWGPYPKNVSNNRVTVEEAPIQILVPDHPVFNHPNRITAADWGGWVQERGLYFLEEKGDPRYQELLAAEDPWEYNKGIKKGMLVEARYGEGRWIYIGLGLFRQLPAGVPSAYKLFANLLSLGASRRVSGE